MAHNRLAGGYIARRPHRLGRFAQLDEVPVATGEVVPQGKVKVIQHLEGGIIDAIHVRDGDTVKEGSPLMQLNLASSGTNREELQVRLGEQILLRARHDAEAIRKKLVFPKGPDKRRPKLVSAQRHSYNARRNELDSKLRRSRQQ